MSATLPEIAEAIVLRPGDKLLLRVYGFPDQDQLEHAQKVVNQQWPDVPVLVVSGDVKVEVIRVESVEDVINDVIYDLEKEAEIE